uniref:Uncharacterized protein n=1 Tax=Anguilla anguilla TaxID=7936 RepID=A0A0E9UR11_ANGAN
MEKVVHGTENRCVLSQPFLGRFLTFS